MPVNLTATSVFNSWIAGISWVAMSIIGGYHLYRFVMDFRTKRGNGPIDFRRQLNAVGLSVACLVVFALFYIWTSFFTKIGSVTLPGCQTGITLEIIFYSATKLATYAALALRVKVIYSKHEHLLPPDHVSFFYMLWALLAHGYLIMCVATAAAAYIDTDNLIYFEISDSEVRCDLLPPGWYNIAFAVLEIGSHTIFSSFFVKPVITTYQQVQMQANARNESKGLKGVNLNDPKVILLTTGTKALVLVAVIWVSTFISSVTFSVGGDPAPSLLPLDVTINCVCLMLMTEYYPDRWFYEKLCLPCLFCCDKSRLENTDRQNSDRNLKHMSPEPAPTDSSASKQPGGPAPGPRDVNLAGIPESAHEVQVPLAQGALAQGVSRQPDSPMQHDTPVMVGKSVPMVGQSIPV